MKSLQLDSPHAIIVIGLQGSGKTFFGRKFAETFKAPFVEQSLFTNAAVDASAGNDLFTTMLSEIAKTGRSVVVELSLASRTERTEIARLLKSEGYTPLFVWVQVDVETAMIRARKTSNTSPADYQERAKVFSQPHPVEKVLVVSGKHTFATQAKAVLRRLTGPRPVSVQQSSDGSTGPQLPSQQRCEIFVV